MLLTADRSGERIDAALARLAPELSRSAAQKLLEGGGVLLNGRPARKSDRLSEGDTLELTLPEVQEVALEAENIPLDIVYEDADVIVVNKPKGLVVHPAAGHWSGTLVNALMYHCRDSLSGIGGELRPGIVHRIDKDTSGLLIAAKNDHAHRALAAQLKDHTLARTYACIVCGNIREDSGTIDAPIGRARPGGPEKDVRHEKGRPRGRDALARAGALSGLYAAGMQTRNGPHTPDPRASGMAEPSDPRGHGLRTQEAGAWDGHAVPSCAGADVPASAHR